jgi:hypothetical protein
MGTEDRCADLYDKSRKTTALTVGAHGTQKEPEDDESEKNGRGERERAGNHAEPVWCLMSGERGQQLPHVIYQLSHTADMTTLNTDTGLPTTTSQHGSEALFGDNPPRGTADIGLDLVGSASLDSSALVPPQSPSSSKVPVPDANNASGSKRKLEDRDSASDTEARTHDRKIPKQESPDERTSSLITPRHMPDIVNVCDVCWQFPLLTFNAEVSAI